MTEHKALLMHYDSLAAAQQPVSREAWMEVAAKDIEIEKALASMSRRFLATVPAKVKS